MKKILLTATFLLLTLTSIAQIRDYKDYNFKQLNSELDRGGMITEEQLNEIDGSPYESFDFSSGKIITNGVVVTDKVYLRYNIYNDQIEKTNFEGSNKPQNLVIEDENSIYVIGFKEYVFINSSNQDLKGYFELIHNSENFKIVKKSKVEYFDKKVAQSSYDKDKPARFDREDSYYFFDENGKLKELPSNRKKIAKAFPSIENKLKKFIKSNRLKFDNQSDYYKLGKFLATSLK